MRFTAAILIPSIVVAAGCGSTDFNDPDDSPAAANVGTTREALQGQWTRAPALPDGGRPTNCNLLTDGRVFCSGRNVPTGTCSAEESNHWWALRPDASGNYANGTWEAQGFNLMGRVFNPSFTMHNGNYWQC